MILRILVSNVFCTFFGGMCFMKSGLSKFEENLSNLSIESSIFAHQIDPFSFPHSDLNAGSAKNTPHIISLGKILALAYIIEKLMSFFK